ncbi:hypothetical protein SLA2020_090610 [Shorea laevis]
MPTRVSQEKQNSITRTGIMQNGHDLKTMLDKNIKTMLDKNIKTMLDKNINHHICLAHNVLDSTIGNFLKQVPAILNQSTEDMSIKQQWFITSWMATREMTSTI